jgi:23S rRNA (cytosine1962-C5)-methyltransferase
MKNITPKYWKNNYKLLDFGYGVKIEKFANIICIRPETNAVNKKTNKKLDFWQKQANLIYNSDKVNSGNWNKQNFPEWVINYKSENINIKLILKTGNSKHIGIFPEQAANWEYIFNSITSNSNVLNLFAYTGAASVVAAKKAKTVVHIDSSKSVIKTAIKNAEINNVKNIKFINDDALQFCIKERKRNNKYDFVILDPPIFGFAGKNKKWKLTRDLEYILKEIKTIITPNAQILMNIYTPQFDIPKTTKLLTNIFGPKSIKQSGNLYLTSNPGNNQLILNNYYIIKPKI